jgi:hypothetical protein
MFPKLWHFSVVVLTTGLLQTPSQAPTPPIPIPPGNVLSEDARQALDKRFKGWTIAPAAACPTPSPQVVAGDLNGDSLGDWAVRLLDADKKAHLVVLMTRFERTDIYDLLQDNGDTVISIVRAGQKYLTTESHIEKYFEFATLHEGPCAGPDRAYVWLGSGFRGVMLAPKP